MDTLQRAFHRSDDPLYRRTERAVWGLILASMALLAVELSLPTGSAAQTALRRVDMVVIWLFVIELVLRVVSFEPAELRVLRGSRLRRLRWHVVGRLRYLTTPMVAIDVLAVLAIVPALRGLRALRILRALRGVSLFRHSDALRGVARALRENALLYAFNVGLLLTIVNVGGISLFLVERGANDQLNRVSDGIWWAMVTITTVGFGDITPVTTIGRLVGGAVMLSGLFMLALFAGMVGGTLLRALMTLRNDTFRMSGHTDHIVVCGYHAGANLLLEALRSECRTTEAEIVVFAPGDRPAELSHAFTWASGDPLKELEFEKIRLAYARTAIVVGSRDVPIEQADARTILAVFTMRAYLAAQPVSELRRAPLHIIAEIVDPENRDHAITAGADEVVETTRVAFDLIAHAAVVPGTGSILSGVASSRAHSLFIEANPFERPRPYDEVLMELRTLRHVTVIGVRSSYDGAVRLNPHGGVTVQPDDELVVLAEREDLRPQNERPTARPNRAGR